MQFKDNEGNDVVTFNHDFDSGILNLSSVKIIKNNTDNKSSIVISGINLSSGETKTVYMDRIANTSYVCVIDEDDANVSEMTSGCTATNEYPVECTEAGGTNGNYTCAIVENNTKLKISGLTHSAVSESDYVYTADPTPAPSPTSSGGGGGGSATTTTCEENWTCGEWQECNEAGLQIRACYDVNDCGTIDDIPTISQTCEYQELNDETTTEEETTENEIIEVENSRITGAVVGTLTSPTGAIVIILLVILVGVSWFYWFYFKRKKH